MVHSIKNVLIKQEIISLTTKFTSGYAVSRYIPNKGIRDGPAMLAPIQRTFSRASQTQEHK